MTTPGPGPGLPPRRASGPWWVRPAVILPVLGAVLVLAMLWTPESSEVDREIRLTTYSTSARAASGLYDVARRLWWPVRRLTAPLRAPLDTDAVYLELAPFVPLSARESAALLDAVRRGAGLVYVVSPADALDDSLSVHRSENGFAVAVTGEDQRAAKHCQRSTSSGAANWLQTTFWPSGLRLYRLITRRPLPDDTAIFLRVVAPDSGPGSVFHSSPAVLGVPVGRGRVVVMSDADLLRNDVLRVCPWPPESASQPASGGVGPAVIRSLDWVSRGGRPPLVFDEYHQGFGLHPGPWRAAVQFLGDTALGHAIAQVAIAALVLLLALGVRPIAPRGERRVERRSPLEHVDALARAYERIGATRTAARRLVGGLRRRHGRGAWAAPTAGGLDADERFLMTLATAHPAAAPDARALLEAERRPGRPADVLAAADAVDRIDRIFSPSKP